MPSLALFDEFTVCLQPNMQQGVVDMLYRNPVFHKFISKQGVFVTVAFNVFIKWYLLNDAFGHHKIVGHE
jgi:hypothetical protein